MNFKPQEPSATPEAAPDPMEAPKIPHANIAIEALIQRLFEIAELEKLMLQKINGDPFDLTGKDAQNPYRCQRTDAGSIALVDATGRIVHTMDTQESREKCTTELQEISAQMEKMGFHSNTSISSYPIRVYRERGESNDSIVIAQRNDKALSVEWYTKYNDGPPTLFRTLKNASHAKLMSFLRDQGREEAEKQLARIVPYMSKSGFLCEDWNDAAPVELCECSPVVNGQRRMIKIHIEDSGTFRISIKAHDTKMYEGMRYDQLCKICDTILSPDFTMVMQSLLSANFTIEECDWLNQSISGSGTAGDCNITIRIRKMDGGIAVKRQCNGKEDPPTVLRNNNDGQPLFRADFEKFLSAPVTAMPSQKI